MAALVTVTVAAAAPPAAAAAVAAAAVAVAGGSPTRRVLSWTLSFGRRQEQLGMRLRTEREKKRRVESTASGRVTGPTG